MRGWEIVIGKLSFPGTAGLGVGPRGNSRRLGPRAPTNKISRSGVGGFHTARGRIDLEDLRFRPWVAGVVEMWKDV